MDSHQSKSWRGRSRSTSQQQTLHLPSQTGSEWSFYQTFPRSVRSAKGFIPRKFSKDKLCELQHNLEEASKAESRALSLAGKPCGFGRKEQWQKGSGLCGKKLDFCPLFLAQFLCARKSRRCNLKSVNNQQLLVAKRPSQGSSYRGTVVGIQHTWGSFPDRTLISLVAFGI